MSIIQVYGFSLKTKIIEAIKILSRAIDGPFEAFNFKVPKGQNKLKPKMKTCYLRISEKLDPAQVVQSIKEYNRKMRTKYKPAILETVPDIPIGLKRKRMVVNQHKGQGTPDYDPLDKIYKVATEEILVELQAKYPGLFGLSKKIGHKLLQDIAKKIFSRIKDISATSKENTCFKLSRAYRRAHPHFGDFQLVLSTLHAIEDAAGTPRSQLEESELASVSATPQTLEIPHDKLEQLCDKYSDKILKRMMDHIAALPSEISPMDTEDEIARKQVRVELKKLSQFLPTIVHQVVNRHLLPRDGLFYRIKIYGEPFLPNKETMGPFLSRYKPMHVLRSTRMYNMLKFGVEPAHFHSLMAMNGTVLNGAKLMIRSSDFPQYRVYHGSTSGEDHADDEVMEQDEGEEEQVVKVVGCAS